MVGTLGMLEVTGMTRMTNAEDDPLGSLLYEITEIVGMMIRMREVCDEEYGGHCAGAGGKDMGGDFKDDWKG